MKTNKIKKVLIALDYDPTAKKVAETGFLLAKTLGAQVILQHVIADAAYYSSKKHVTIMGFAGSIDKIPLQSISVDVLKEESQHFLDKSKHYLGDETIQTCVTEGNFAESLLMTAKELHADIIVMGSHTSAWLEKIVMGSVTEKVLHHTTIPLFIIPTKRRK